MSRDPLEYALNRMEAERDKPPPTVGYPAARQDLLDGIASLRSRVAVLEKAVEWALNEGCATAQNEGWDAYEAELRRKLKEG